MKRTLYLIMALILALSSLVVIQPPEKADAAPDIELSYQCVEVFGYNLIVTVDILNPLSFAGKYMTYKCTGALPTPKTFEKFSYNGKFLISPPYSHPLTVLVTVYDTPSSTEFIAQTEMTIDCIYYCDLQSPPQTCILGDVDGQCCNESCCPEGNCKQCGSSTCCCDEATDTCFETGFPAEPVICCPEGTEVCTDVPGSPYCCPTGECCNGVCCDPSYCCNNGTLCCPSTCCGDECCSFTETCCNSGTEPCETECCGDVCCDEGEVCSDGQCVELGGSITAHKFEDLSGNGILDAGEPGLDGWEISLYAGSDCAGTAMDSRVTDGNVSFVNLLAGDYSVSETLQAGWQNTTDLCQNVTLAEGGSEIVNFGNQELAPQTGTIIVEKITDPSHAIDQFTFTGDAAGSIKNGEQIVVSDLPPGTYTSTELVPAVWDLIAISCDDGNSTGDVNTATATFQLEAGETCKCTFYNKMPLGGIIHGYKFNDINGNGIDDNEPRVSGVTITLTGDLNADGITNEVTTTTDPVTGEYEFMGLFPGPYTITETPPAGCIPTTSSVVDIMVPGGAVIVALPGQRSFTHPDQFEVVDNRLAFGNRCLGSITVVKDINIGAVADGAFCFNTDLLGSFRLPYGGGNYSMVWTDLEPGVYTITESTPPEDWSMTGVICTGGDCTPITDGVTVNLNRGEDITVTFTNEYDDGGTPPIPEMTTILLMSLGLITLGGLVWYRRRGLVSVIS